MKIKNLFFSLFACAALFACQSDDENVGTSSFGGDEAYMSIQVFNANGAATRGSDGGFENGEPNEGKVSSVDFYFYNNDGTFNQHVGKNDIAWTEQTDGNNVEQVGAATIVLKNLKQVGQPKYVVAVLNDNRAGDRYKYLNINELNAALVNDYKASDFIMTNSTHNPDVCGLVDEKGHFYGTIIQESNFLKEKPSTKRDELTAANTVQLYVERLAVKVRVSAMNQLLDGDNVISLGKFLVDNGDKAATGVASDSTEIKIKVLGWGLNATAKNSYLMKQVPEWNYFAAGQPNGEWNAWIPTDAYHRTFWAKSTNWGKGTYPTSYSYTGATAEDGLDETNTLKAITDAGATLNYFSWNEMQMGLGAHDYCMENTNTKDILKTNNNIKSTVTHVLLKAEISTKETLVRFYGQLYTQTGFMKNVLSQVATKYYQVDAANTTADKTAYKSIDIADIAPATVGDGKVYVTLADASTKWYVKTGEDTYAAVEATEVNAALLNVFKTSTAAGSESNREYADYYNGGMMYYCIPIEHLRGGKIVYSQTNDGTYEVNEGDYGVVRNHLYNLTVNKIENLGTAVYDADEDIVPNPEIPTYFVGASINILAWQVVNQNVEL